MTTATDRDSMAGQTCVITGATSGIGEASAEELHARGARIVLIARSAQRADDTLARLSRSRELRRRPAAGLLKDDHLRGREILREFEW